MMEDKYDLLYRQCRSHVSYFVPFEDKVEVDPRYASPQVPETREAPGRRFIRLTEASGSALDLSGTGAVEELPVESEEMQQLVHARFQERFVGKEERAGRADKEFANSEDALADFFG